MCLIQSNNLLDGHTREVHDLPPAEDNAAISVCILFIRSLLNFHVNLRELESGFSEILESPVVFKARKKSPLNAVVFCSAAMYLRDFAFFCLVCPDRKISPYQLRR